MATTAVVSRQLPLNFSSEGKLKTDTHTNETTDAGEYDGEVLTGAQFSEKTAFKNRRGKEITVTPIIVEFRRLLQSNSSVEVVPGISNRDLLHAVVGLYDVSLSDMTPEVLYATVCEHWARTIILIRNITDTLEEIEVRKRAKISKTTSSSTQLDVPSKEAEKNVHNQEDGKPPSCVTSPQDGSTEDRREDAEDVDVLEPEEQTPGKFDDVFSDTDEESEDCDEDDEEDFSKGIKAFLAAVAARREARGKHEGPLEPEHIGVENRLVAASTFKKAYCKPSEKVNHLTLLAVRLRFRKWGIGKYLLQQVKNPKVVGQYDAVVVHADNDAVEFFQRYGFTDDTVLNNKWSELAEQFTNCTLMCYLPPFTGQTLLSESLPELDIIAMEREVKKWRLKAQEAYVAEVSCMDRMRHEIIHLRALVSSQQELMNQLMSDNDSLRKEKYLTERQFMEYRLNGSNSGFGQSGDMDEEEDLGTEQLLKDLEKEVARTARRKDMYACARAEGERNRFMVSRGSLNEPYCHGRDTEDFFLITQEFTDTMKRDLGVVIDHQVKMVTKATLPPSVVEQISTCMAMLKEPNMVTRLYYCGGLEHRGDIGNILMNGFSETDFSIGEYGRGLYFSKFPSKAAQFSASGKLIVAEVGLGKTQTVLKKDRTRSRPDSDNESIITPGRLIPSDLGTNDSMLCQEYVIFSAHQARPLYLVEYAPNCA